MHCQVLYTDLMTLLLYPTKATAMAASAICASEVPLNA